MTDARTAVIPVEDDPADARLIREALQVSEARFRAMSDAAPLGIFVSDEQGGCVYTNAAYQKISGLTFEQALGTGWSMAIHPEDRQRVLADCGAAAQSDAPWRRTGPWGWPPTACWFAATGANPLSRIPPHPSTTGAAGSSGR
jgi:PAS domain-containing protein